jgi:prevent-host-death family protein
MTEIYGVAEAKRRFAELIDRVRDGERVVVTRHGKPAVAIVPPGAVDVRLPAGRPTGFAALAGALEDVEGFDEVMDEVVRSRRSARERPVPELD